MDENNLTSLPQNTNSVMVYPDMNITRNQPGAEFRHDSIKPRYSFHGGKGSSVQWETRRNLSILDGRLDLIKKVQKEP